MGPFLIMVREFKELYLRSDYESRNSGGATPKTEEIRNIARRIYDAGRRRGHEEATLGLPCLEELADRADSEASRLRARQRPALFIVRG